MRAAPPWLFAACLARAATASAAPEPASDDVPRLRAYLRALAASGDAVGASQVKLAPARPGVNAAVRPGPLLELSPARLAFDGAPVEPSALATVLEETRARRRLLGVDPGRALVVDLDGATPWPRVVEVLVALAKLPVDPVLRFHRDPPAPPFDKTPLDADLAKLRTERDVAAKSSGLTRLYKGVFARCERGNKAMAQLTTVGPGDRSRVLLSLLDRLFDEPTCKLDPRAVQALVTSTVGGPLVVGLPIKLDAKAKPGERVMAGLSATWGEAVGAGLLDKLAKPGARPTLFVLAPR